MTEKEMRERISPKVEEAAEQYRRAELFWYCSTMSDEEIAKRRRAFVTSYEKELKEFFDAIFPRGTHSALGEEEKKYLEKTGLASIMEEYRTMEEEKSKVRQPKESLGKMDPAESDTLSDPTITEEQREGLRQFHQWLYRNCDRKGIKYFGEKLFGSDGSARNFADKFMSQPASVQLKALYLLENDKRKIPDTSGQFNVESQVDYVPNLDRLKDKMTATKWKFWKRTNGSYLYWHKLNESLEAANEDREALLKYRKEANERYQKDPEEYKKTRTIQALLSFSGKLEEKNQEKDKEDGNSGVDLVSNATDRILNPYYAVDYVQSGSIDVEGISTGTSSDDLDGYVSRFLKSVGSEKLASHYDKISTLGLESVAVVSGLLSMYSGGKELAAMRGVSSTLENAQAVAGIGTDTMYTAQSVTSITETIGEYVKASEEFASTIGTAGTAIFGGVNLLIAAKGGIGYLSSQRNEKHAKRAKKLGEELKDKKLQDRAEFARYLSEKKKHKGIREFIQGSAGVTSAAISLFASAVPVAGQVAGVIAVSMALYEGYVKANENLQEKYRKGIDTELFDGGKDLEKRDTDFKKQLQERIRKFPEGSAQRKKLEELCRDKNKEKRYDILRKEEAVRQDCVFLRDCYEKVIGAMGEEAYRNVFYIDPKKGGSYENLITKENQEKYFTPQKIEDSDTAEVKAKKEEHNRQVLIRTSYKELMESFGTKTKFESEEKLQRDLKKKEKGKDALPSVRETMEQKAEEKRKKVMDAFTKA